MCRHRVSVTLLPGCFAVLAARSRWSHLYQRVGRKLIYCLELLAETVASGHGWLDNDVEKATGAPATSFTDFV